MRVIPAIDIIDGHCVRLTGGDYGKKSEYSSSPLSVAKSFEDAGLERLHLVDLDGAKSNGIKNIKVLESISKSTSLVIDFGGGIKKEDDLKAALDAGARYVTLGSLAAKDRDLTLSLLEKYKDHLILGADSKDGIVKTSGWLSSDGDHDVISFIKSYEGLGFSAVISTDISRDGMLSGPAVALYKKIMEETKIPLIASGGVSSYKDLVELNKMGLSGVIVGKAYYENRISLKELKEAESAC